jgi:thiol-disulfide isomerase/thioredoxin
MRALCVVTLVGVVCLSGPGCAVFGKKDSSGERHGGISSWFKKKETSPTNPPPPKFPDPIVTSPGVPPPTPPPTPGAQSAVPVEPALLAGRVVDAYNRPANNTYVRLVNLDQMKDGGTPIDVATSAEGYFTIPGLKSGGQYQLIARTKAGEKLLAGITVTQAPNVRVLIQVKEEFASDNIPPIPAAASAPPAVDNKAIDNKRDNKVDTTSSLDSKPPPLAVWTPAASGGNSTLPSTPIDVPAQLNVPGPSAPPPAVASVPNRAWPPPLQINGQKPTAAAPKPASLPSASANNSQPGLPPLVPSAVVVAGSIQSLALKDVDDQTWTFAKDRRGKVVLLDFWKHACPPCRQTMPILSQMQTKFGPQGLEVVGIVIDSGTVKDQAVRAKEACYRLQTNYRQLVGQDDRTHLCQQFDVDRFPTLVLVDDTGRILWRHVGAPEQAMLESVLQKHLASRGF